MNSGSISMVFKSLRAFRFNSIFYKVFLTVLILVIFFGALNFLSISYSKSNMKENELRSQRMLLDKNTLILDNLFMRIKDDIHWIQQDYHSSKLFLVGKTDYKFNSLAYKMVQRMSIIKTDNSMVSNYFVYDYRNDYIIDDTGTTDTAVYFSNRYIEGYELWNAHLNNIHKFNIETNRYYSNLKESFEPGIVHTPSRVLLLHTLYEGINPCGTLVVCFNEEYINGILKNAVDLHSEQFHIVDEKGKIINSTRSNMTGNLIDIESIDDNYLVSYKDSVLGNLSYVVVTDKAVLFSKVMKRFYFFNAMLFAFLLIGLFLSFYISQKIYMPICRIVDNLNKSMKGIYSQNLKGNEISFIQSNLSVIMTSNNNLKYIIKESIPYVTDILLLKILMGNLDYEDFLKISNEFGVAIREGLYFTAVLSINITDMDNIEYKEDDSGIGMSKMLKSHNSGIFNNVISILKIKNEYVVVFYLKEKSELSEIKAKLRELIKYVENEKKYIKVYCGLGNYTENIYSIFDSYKQAVESLSIRSIDSTERLIEYAGKDASAKEILVLPVDMEQKLINYVTSGNLKMVNNYIGRLFDMNVRKNVLLGTYRKMCMSLYSIAISIASDWSSNDDILTSKNYASGKTIERIADVELLNKIITDIYTKITRYFMDVSQKQKDIIEKIIDYIDNNIDQDISLDNIADDVGLTANYLTRLFKRRTGVNYSSYIQSLRIRKAKEMLENSNMKIRDVAKYVGYTSPGVFIRMFKRNVGLSPGEYKQNAKIMK